MSWARCLTARAVRRVTTTQTFLVRAPGGANTRLWMLLVCGKALRRRSPSWIRRVEQWELDALREELRGERRCWRILLGR
jgi:hypothetical protein